MQFSTEDSTEMQFAVRTSGTSTSVQQRQCPMMCHAFKPLSIMPQEYSAVLHGKRLHRFFWNIFFAVKKTFSEGAVEAGKLDHEGSMIRAFSTNPSDHL